MIYYSLDNKSRAKTYFGLAVVSIGLTILFNYGLIYIFERYSSNRFEQIKDFLQIPSILTIYASVIYLYDNHMWKYLGLPKLHKIPTIEGQWSGVLSRSSNLTNPNDQKEVQVQIKQTWSKISVILDTAHTKSSCISVNLRINETESEFLMLYEWKPKNLKDANMFGEGAQKLILKRNDPTVLSGPYFSTKGNSGVISIRK